MKEVTLKVGRRRLSIDRRKLRRIVRDVIARLDRGEIPPHDPNEIFIITNKLPPKKSRKKA